MLAIYGLFLPRYINFFIFITQMYLTFLFLLFTDYGRDVKALVERPLEEELMHPGKNTVSYESRALKALMMQLM